MESVNRFKTVKALRLLYVLWVLLGVFSLMYVPSQLIESGDALASSRNIADNTALFRLGILGSLATQVLFIIIPLLLYQLFKKVDQQNSILMVALALVSVPITMYNETNKLFLLNILDEPDRVTEMLELHNYGMTISIIFWGAWLLPLAWLVYRAAFFPKFIAYFLVIGGLGYLLGAILGILGLKSVILTAISEIMTMGELVFVLWLIILGGRITRTSN